ncbi:MAG: hypothetical protein J6R39_01680, partial [Oscillospiraceae bacterium]|nr:hypothetical protein [Oscillospiraceae bacterium]
QEFQDRKVYNIGNSKLNKEAAPAAAEVPCCEPGSDCCKQAPAAAVQGKAILFSRVTCPNCKVSEAQLIKAGVPLEKLIADENVELCKQYGIKGAPTLVITDGTNFNTYYSVPEIKKYLASL